MPIIYIDVLFMVNLAVNFLLLRASCIFSGAKFNKIRVCFAALIGACYAVLIFFPDYTIIRSTIYKLLISILLNAVAFPFYSLSGFVKSLLIFYAVSFGFGGCVLGVFYFSDIGEKFGAVYSNGILYFNLPWTILAISGIIFYISVKIVNALSRKNLRIRNLRKKLFLYFKNNTTEVTALLDTGNSLVDPISLSPVVIVEYKFLKSLFNKEIQNVLNRMGSDNIEWIMNDVNECGLATRLIPFSSLGKENGMLLGFIPDRAEIHDECGIKILDRCVVGIYNSSLSKDKSYGALLNPYL